ncbi:Fic family protein [Brucella cytisi]|uniref:Uncharacterized protein n=1 Tax=Brucella cytisi TaxID=407152 RepID=A0A1J6I2S9_9HYPH|nr:Fic family protein [Brucella cytisi]OIS92094.1 hypothetical protein BLA27_18495 [Brucella cytisi]
MEPDIWATRIEGAKLSDAQVEELLSNIRMQSFITRDEQERSLAKPRPWTLRNDVVAFDVDGREPGIVFSTASPFETPREMEALVAWTLKAIDEESLHPLLNIAVFIVKFLAIHPSRTEMGGFRGSSQRCCYYAQDISTYLTLRWSAYCVENAMLRPWN